jgi:hypothetical protein
MLRRLATMCFMAMLLIRLSSQYVHADDSKAARETLKGINTVSVLIETLPDGRSYWV